MPLRKCIAGVVMPAAETSAQSVAHGYSKATEPSTAALKALKATDPTRCVICGQPFTEDNPMTGGHKVAIRNGGTSADGLEAQCRRCNYAWRSNGL